MERSLHEIFTAVAEESSINKKEEILKDNDSQGLQVFLRCVFDDMSFISVILRCVFYLLKFLGVILRPCC